MDRKIWTNDKDLINYLAEAHSEYQVSYLDLDGLVEGIVSTLRGTLLGIDGVGDLYGRSNSNVADMCEECLCRVIGQSCRGVEEGEDCLNGEGPQYDS